MPVPEMIWLNTANAPRPRAASVDAPANATPGDSSIAITTRAAMRFIASPPCRIFRRTGVLRFVWPFRRRLPNAYLRQEVSDDDACVRRDKRRNGRLGARYLPRRVPPAERRCRILDG